MARIHTGHMALYEAVNQERFKAAQEKELERIAQEKAVPAQSLNRPMPQPQGPVTPVTAQKEQQVRSSVWQKRAAPVQWYNGKIEASIPYPFAITVAMVLVLLLILFYQLGKWSRPAMSVVKTTGQSQVLVAKTAEAAKKMVQISTAPVTKPVIQQVVSKAASTGNTVIVIKQMSDMKNLVPVKEFFDAHGIATEIKNVGGSYFLVTKTRFEGVGKGSDGYATLEKIKGVGRRYKSPPGYGSFAPKMFDDAYGKKM